MGSKFFYQVPEAVSGYELDPNKGWFSVVIPKVGINLDTNPSYELSTSGATAVNSTLARSSTYQRRGAYSMEVTPSSASDSGYYKELVTVTGENYCFGLDLYDPGGRIFWLYFADSSGNRVGRVQEIRTIGGSVDTPGWQRVWVNFSEYAGGTRRLYVIRKATTGTPRPATTPFYVDGSLIENQDQPSIYFDGDSTGFVSGQTAFFWSGIRHASTSERLADTGAGGTEMKLIDLGFRVMAIVGLGLAPFANIATPLSTGGAYYQQSMPQTRQFMLAGTLTETNLPALERFFDKLAASVSPQRLPIHQPLILRYHTLDDCTGDETEIINIPCVYEGGLEGGVDNHNQQRIGITFRQYLPTIYKDGELGAKLDEVITFDNSRTQYRDVDGFWKTTDATTAQAFHIDSDGVLWMSDTRLRYWNGITWVTFATADLEIYDFAFLSDGSIVAVGPFTSIESVAAAKIAKYNPVTGTWSALGTGLTGILWGVATFGVGLAVDSLDNVYVVGDFTHANGVLVNGVTKLAGTTFTALGSGLNNQVVSVMVTPSDVVWVVGDFTTAGGGAANRIAYWDGTWHALGTGANGRVSELTIDPDGNIYGIGAFTTVNGVTVNYVFKYDGTTVTAMGNGMGQSCDLEHIAYLSDGGVYVFGGGTNPTTVSGRTLTLPGAAIWYDDTQTWTPFDLTYAGGSLVSFTSAPIIDNYGRFWMGINITGQDMSYSNNPIELNNGTPVYPVFEFIGPGAVWYIKNYTTGGYIYFDNLILVAGEQLIFSPDPFNYQFYSTIRGDMRAYIQPGPNTVDLFLTPGINRIAAWFTETTAASDSIIRWRHTLTTLQGARR